MSDIKNYVENFTDEQLISSAYMCCQRNAVKAAWSNLNNSNNYRINFNTRQAKREYKQMHRDSHMSITFKGFMRFYGLFLVLAYFASYLIYIKNPASKDIIEKIFLCVITGVLIFPIVRKLIIELQISSMYRKLKTLYKNALTIDAPQEANLSTQLQDMDNYLSQNCVIPSKYWDYALNLIEYIYVDYRATNLREAINILEEDLHRRKLENKMAEIEQLSIENANAINDMIDRIDDIECFQNYLHTRQKNLEWDLYIEQTKTR